MEKFLPPPGGAVSICAEQRAKVGLGSPQGYRIGVRLSKHRLELLVEGVDGKVVRAGVIDLVGNNSVVTLLPVRPVQLLGPVDFDAVLEAVAVANVAVDDKLRRVIPSDIKVGGEQIGEKPTPTRMEITEPKGDSESAQAKNSWAWRVRSAKGRRKATWSTIFVCRR